MAGRLLAVLLGLSAVLAGHAEDTGLQGPSSLDFDPVKFSGLWYETALASKMVPPSTNGARLRRVGAVQVQVQGKTLQLTSTFDNLKGCVKVEDQALQGDAPGTFTVSQESGRKEVRILYTDYKTFAIMTVTLHKGGSTYRSLKLYSRDLSSTGEARKKFSEAVVENGFTEEDVHFLDTNDKTCVDLLSS